VPLAAEQADALGLVTMILDDIDWDDEAAHLHGRTRQLFPRCHDRDGGQFAVCRTRDDGNAHFGRLTAWQNWIFNRPNAVGEEGALQRYGTGVRGKLRYGTGVDAHGCSPTGHVPLLGLINRR